MPRRHPIALLPALLLALFVAPTAPLGCASEAPAPAEPRRPPLAPTPPPVPIVLTSLVDDCPPLEVDLPELEQGPGDPGVVPPILDARRLGPFFERSARVLRGRADDHVRIAIYGDSNLARDFVSGRMRRWLQSRHGDAGHGYVALIRPWGNYRHMDVRHKSLKGFHSYNSSTNPVFDQRVGIGGIAAESSYVGATTWVATAEDPAPVGQAISRADLFYLAGRYYGTFDIEVDGTVMRTVDPRAAVPRPDEARTNEVRLAVEHLELDDAPHELRFITRDNMRRTRLLGVVLERDIHPPSFVVDSLGVGGLNTLSQARQNREVNLAMLRERNYDLIIFGTGANDPFTINEVPGALAKVVALQREALGDDVPILMLTPADRGKRRTFPGTLAVVEQREAFAKENGTAFWNLFQAMGGPNVMRAWRQRGFAREDYIHYTWEGGAWVADRLLYALWRELGRYLDANPRAGCERPKSVVQRAEGALPKGAAATPR